MTSKEEKKQDIIKVAIKMFCIYGFHKTKIEDVAHEAGIGKGTIYQYFSSKEELFEETIGYSILKFCKPLQGIITKEASVKEKLILLSYQHRQFISENMDLWEMLMREPHVLSTERKKWLGEQKERIYGFLKTILEEGLRTGELRKDLNVEFAMFALVGLFNQYYAQKLFTGSKAEELDPVGVADFLYRALV